MEEPTLHRRQRENARVVQIGSSADLQPTGDVQNQEAGGELLIPVAPNETTGRENTEEKASSPPLAVVTPRSRGVSFDAVEAPLTEEARLRRQGMSIARRLAGVPSLREEAGVVGLTSMDRMLQREREARRFRERKATPQYEGFSSGLEPQKPAALRMIEQGLETPISTAPDAQRRLSRSGSAGGQSLSRSNSFAGRSLLTPRSSLTSGNTLANMTLETLEDRTLSDIDVIRKVFEQYPRYRDVLLEALGVIDTHCKKLHRESVQGREGTKVERNDVSKAQQSGPFRDEVQAIQHSIEESLATISEYKDWRLNNMVEEEENLEEVKSHVQRVKERKVAMNERLQKNKTQLGAMFEQYGQNTAEMSLLDSLDGTLESAFRENTKLSEENSTLTKALQAERRILADARANQELKDLEARVVNKGLELPGRKVTLQRAVAKAHAVLGGLREELADLEEKNQVLEDHRQEWEDVYRAKEAVELKGWTPRPDYAAHPMVMQFVLDPPSSGGRPRRGSQVGEDGEALSGRRNSDSVAIGQTLAALTMTATGFGEDDNLDNTLTCMPTMTPLAPEDTDHQLMFDTVRNPGVTTTSPTGAIKTRRFRKSTTQILDATCKKYNQMQNSLRRAQEEFVRFTKIIAPVNGIMKFLYTTPRRFNLEETSVFNRKLSIADEDLLGGDLAPFGTEELVPTWLMSQRSVEDEQWTVQATDKVVIQILKFLSSKSPATGGEKRAGSPTFSPTTQGSFSTQMSGNIAPLPSQREEMIQQAFMHIFPNVSDTVFSTKVLNCLKACNTFQAMSPLCHVLLHVFQGSLPLNFIDAPFQMYHKLVSQFGAAELHLRNCFVVITRDYAPFNGFGLVEQMELRYALIQDISCTNQNIVRPWLLGEDPTLSVKDYSNMPKDKEKAIAEAKLSPKYGLLFRTLISHYFSQADHLYRKIGEIILNNAVCSELIPDTVLIAVPVFRAKLEQFKWEDNDYKGQKGIKYPQHRVCSLQAKPYLDTVLGQCERIDGAGHFPPPAAPANAEQSPAVSPARRGSRHAGSQPGVVVAVPPKPNKAKQEDAELWTLTFVEVQQLMPAIRGVPLKINIKA